MKTQMKSSGLTPFDHMMISAGGRTQREMEASATTAMNGATVRQMCRRVSRGLARAAAWFEARARVTQAG